MAVEITQYFTECPQLSHCGGKVSVSLLVCNGKRWKRQPLKIESRQNLTVDAPGKPLMEMTQCRQPRKFSWLKSKCSLKGWCPIATPDARWWQCSMTIRVSAILRPLNRTETGNQVAILLSLLGTASWTELYTADPECTEKPVLFKSPMSWYWLQQLTEDWRLQKPGSECPCSIPVTTETSFKWKKKS